MKKLVYFCVLLNTVAFAQNGEGYFGKRMHFSIDTELQTPLMYNMVSNHVDNPKNSDDLSEKKFDLINYGVNLSLGYVVKRNVMINMEVGMEYSDMYMSARNTLENYEYYNFKFQKMGVSTLSILPIVEIGGKNSLFPLGLSHQIGLGYSQSRIVKRNYNSQVLNSSGYYIDLNPSYLQDHYYDYEREIPYKHVTLMYGLNMRTAIAKNLMFNYGFRYIFRVSLKDDYLVDESFIFDQEEVKGEIYDQQTRRILRFKCGFTFVF
jgi:hypothetical protein